ncbi:MAG: dihydroorotate dehydrogenase electron transfer subunit [Firmicutes bacterium]|nr:dihydroorotate dehydrogenase electron transfer subunit [Bacillota bacterium]
MKQLFDAEILFNAEIKPGIFDLRLYAPEIAGSALPGQFVSVYPDSPRNILPRPFSVCGAENGAVRIVYKTVGEGTAQIAGKREGERLRVGGPMGCGFRPPGGKSVLLVGGGVGAPPLLFLARKLRKERPGAVIAAAMGFRTAAQVILEAEFNEFCDSVIISTDDGSLGEKGSVVEAIRAFASGGKEEPPFSEICACGPKPMLGAIAAYAREKGAPCQVSLEERMACGIGACLGCAVRIRNCADAGSCPGTRNGGEAPYYKRVCADGPVFDAREVAWDE